MEQDQETLGRYLKRERETRHVTVEEIALFVGVKRSLADALEADDFGCFSGRLECRRLVKRYIAYLNLNSTEAVRRFETQWKLYGAVKRYPKLTDFTDGDEPRKKRWGFRRKRLFAGVSPVRIGWLSSIAGLLIVVPILFQYLPEWKPEGLPPEPSPPSRVEEMTMPAAERPRPPVRNTAVSQAAPRRVPAVDPLYSPPDRSGEKSVPAQLGVRVVGNRDTKRYHLPGMKYYDQVKEYHRVIFQSEREALRAGYVKARQ
jgi:cytoskeletal protein RodZ